MFFSQLWADHIRIYNLFVASKKRNHLFTNLKYCKKASEPFKSLPTISVPEISASVISARMFQHRNVSTWGPFGMGIFWHEEFSAQEHFSTWTFRHSSTGAKMSVLKCPYCFARCQNIHGAKNSLCQNVPVPKSYLSKHPGSRYVRRAETCRY